MCWFLWSWFSCHFYNRPATFLGFHSFLSAVCPGIDNVFPVTAGKNSASYWGIRWLIAAGHCVALSSLFCVCVRAVLLLFPFFSSLHIFIQFYSMSGTQILDPYFLLSSTDNIFPCVKEHFWYLGCMYVICYSLAYTTKIPCFKVCR